MLSKGGMYCYAECRIFIVMLTVREPLGLILSISLIIKVLLVFWETEGTQFFSIFQRTGRVMVYDVKVAERLIQKQGGCTSNQVC